MSGSDKWIASQNSWESNRKSNLQKAANEFSDNDLIKAIQDQLNNYYNTAPLSKYYFRDEAENRNNEYNSAIKKVKDSQVKNAQKALTNASKMYDPIYGGGFNANFADQYLNNYLTMNYNDALDQLNRAKSRGTINDIGYNRALNDLSNQLSANKSTYGAIGRDIVSGYNTGMQTNINNYQNLLDNYNLNTDFERLNANVINKSLSDSYNNYLAGFENDFDAAMSGQTPFDVSGILGNAKVAQGVVNPQTNSLVDAISEQNSKKKQKVGLGNEGIF